MSAVCASIAAAERKPNVVVFLADDLGYSDLGCYGGEIQTPNLDGLAKNGLRFTQFYNTARCWPTRSSLLTGYYAQQIRRDAVPGVRSGGQGVRPAWAKLLPEMLKPLGYRSYHSGKWHVDGKVLDGGFSRCWRRARVGCSLVPGYRLRPIPGQAPRPTHLPPGCAFAPRCVHAEERCSAPQSLDAPVDERLCAACAGPSWRAADEAALAGGA